MTKYAYGVRLFDRPFMTNFRSGAARLLFASVLACAPAGCYWSASTTAKRTSEDLESRPQPVMPQAASSEQFMALSDDPLSGNPWLAEEFRNEDPTVAGWESEAFHDLENAQLKHLGEFISAGKVAATKLEDLVAVEIQFSPLRPAGLEVVYADDTVVVQRPAGDSEIQLRGPEAFVSALNSLIDDAQASDARVKYKGLHVELKEDSAVTVADFQLSWRHPGGTSQVNSVWTMEWTREAKPRLRSVRVSDYEEVRPAPTGRLQFDDVALRVLGRNASYGEQLIQGYDYWRARSDRALGSDLAGNQGIAVGDVNGDGLDDIYVLQPGGLPNRLYVHQKDGTAIDKSHEAHVDYLDFSRAALFLDLDNDGDQDLVLGMSPGLLLLANDGSGQFKFRKALPCPGSVYSLCAADYDNDGLIDVFACGRYPQGALREETRVQGLPIPYHDANNGGPSSLWRNAGSFHFEDVTEQVGLDANNRRFTLAAAWEDFDNDGDQDLYIANDFGRNNLYRNDGGRFIDVAAAEGVEDIGAGMSASWGDANNDGRMDLYVGNMFSSAGHRVAFQPQFMPDVDSRTRSEFQRHARGNSLFLNRGKRDTADFDDVTMPAHVNLGRWAWGALFVDLNNDGWEDLFVANGFITTASPGDL